MTPESRHERAAERGAQLGLDDPGRTTVTLECWWDAEVARSGHDATSPYVETFWLPVLGPSSTLLLRWCARALPEHPGGLALPVAEVAGHLGLGRSAGRNGPVLKSLARLSHFGLARRLDRGFEVRSHVPALPDHLARRLPPDLRRAHRPAGRPSAPGPHPDRRSTSGATGAERAPGALRSAARSAARP